jgi:hypothetical protein
MIHRPAPPVTQAEANAASRRFGAKALVPRRAEGQAGTFEPCLGGDRQRLKRVAKPRNPLQSGRLEVSLS